MLRQAVSLGHPPRGPGRPVHRDPRPGAVRPVGLRDPVTAQVEAVIGMQVAQADRVDGGELGVPLQRAEGPVAEVEHQPESLVLHEVGRGGTVRAGERPGASDDGEAHGISSWVARAGARRSRTGPPQAGPEPGPARGRLGGRRSARRPTRAIWRLCATRRPGAVPDLGLLVEPAAAHVPAPGRDPQQRRARARPACARSARRSATSPPRAGRTPPAAGSPRPARAGRRPAPRVRGAGSTRASPACRTAGPASSRAVAGSSRMSTCLA